MLMAYLTIGGLLVGLALLAERRGPPAIHQEARREAWRQLRPLLLRLPVALIAASFLAALLPAAHVARIFGEAAGVRGVLVASLIGAMLPGGPMVAFPLAVALFEAGAGTAPMVALLTAWSVLAFHRVIAFEAPMAGLPFSLGRLAASLILPPLAGLLAMGVVTLMR